MIAVGVGAGVYVERHDQHSVEQAHVDPHDREVGQFVGQGGQEWPRLVGPDTT
jgi:hypothetical protein